MTTTAPLYDVPRGAAIWREHMDETDIGRSEFVARTMLQVIKARRETPREAVPAEVVLEAVFADTVPPEDLTRATAAVDAMIADLIAQQAEVLAAHEARVAALKAFNLEEHPDIDPAAISARDEDRCRFCARKVVWSGEREHDRGTHTLADPEAGISEDNVVVACGTCNRSRAQLVSWHPLQASLLPPYSERKFAHELHPGPKEYEVQPIDDAVRYHYARALGAGIPHDDGALDSVSYPQRILDMISARHLAYLYDALAQGLTGQEAVDFAENATWDYEGEIVWERAEHYGIDPNLIKHYPIDDDHLVGRVLHGMAGEVRAVNKANGWFEDDRTVGDDVALLHSEVSEALEAFRTDGLEDATGESCVTDIEGRHLHGATPCKPEGFGSELADVLIRLLDTADRRGIDLAAEYRRKLAYNRTRSHRHGGKRL